MNIQDTNRNGYEQLWLDSNQLCARLHIGKTTLYRWINEGRFPEGKKMGKRAVRWHKEQLETFEQDMRGQYE